VEDGQAELEVVLTRMGEFSPALQNDLTIRQKIETIPSLPYGPDPSQLAAFLFKFENFVCKPSAPAFTDQDRLALISKFHPKTFAEIRSERICRSQTDI